MKLQLFQPKETPPDIFDRVGKDIFDRTELDPADKLKFDPDIQRMIDLKVDAAVQAAIRVLPKPAPAKETIREIRVEVPKKDTRDLVEKSQLDAALKKIAELEKSLEETDRRARAPIVVPSPGGSGVIGIPPPEAASVGQVLTVHTDRKAKWKDATGGSGAGLSGYTVSSFTELKTFDPADTSLDELARVVGSIIEDLQP